MAFPWSGRERGYRVNRAVAGVAARVTLVVVLVGLTVAQQATGAARAAADLDDSEVAFCLNRTRADGLRDTIIALDLPDRSTLSDLPGWRSRHQAEFERACTALYSAEKVVRSPWADLLPFLTGFAAAALAFFAAAWRDRITRGRQTADALRKAVAEFKTAATTFVENYAGNRQQDKLRAARGVLAAELSEVVASHRRWVVARAEAERVESGPLAHQPMSEGWTGTAADATKAADLKAEIRCLDAQAVRLVRALSRPWHPHVSLWRIRR